MAESAPVSPRTPQTIVGTGIVLVGLALGVGALSIPSAAGYGGVGPNFLPWLVAGVLALCGVLIVREALTGGFRNMEPPSGAHAAWWPGLVWVTAGMLANAALITTIGFVLSCSLCFVLAVRGLRLSEGKPAGGVKQTVIDLVTGLLISLPVFWMFTKLLAINLPGVADGGWI